MALNSFAPSSYSQATASTTAFGVLVPTTDPVPTTALITNLSPSRTLFVGFTQPVNEDNGVPVLPQSQFALDVTGQTEIYIANDGDPTNLSIPVKALIAWGA